MGKENKQTKKPEYIKSVYETQNQQGIKCNV